MEYLFLGIGVAFMLYFVLYYFLLPVFWIYISPLFGCSPIGNASNLFSIYVFSSPPVVATCPFHSEYALIGLLLYLLVILSAFSIFVSYVKKSYIVIALGIFLPEILLIFHELNIIHNFDITYAWIISLIVVLIGLANS